MAGKNGQRQVKVRATAAKNWGPATLLLWLLPLTAAALLAASFWFCLKHLYLDNPFFTLRQITVNQTHNFPPQRVETILAELPVTPGQVTLPRLDLGLIRERLIREPAAAQIRVRRIYPDGLHIDIRERPPVATLVFPAATRLPPYILDSTGRILPGTTRGAVRSLPMVIGTPDPYSLKIGETTRNKALLALIDLLGELEIRPEGALYDVQMLRIDQKNDNLTMILRQKGVFSQGAQVILPMRKIPAALDRLEYIVRLRHENAQTISRIDVTYEKNIPVIP